MTGTVVQETMEQITGPNAGVVAMSDLVPFKNQGKIPIASESSSLLSITVSVK
jgi:hypothetical protein